MEQDEIIQQITNELLEDIENSNDGFTNDEIKNKIDQKLQNILDGLDKKEELNTENGSALQNVLIEKNESNNDLTNNDKIENSKEKKQKKEKKSFLSNFEDLYKNELNESMDSFRKILDSLFLIKNGSVVEKILIFFILSVPTILACIFGFLFALILICLWKMYIFANMLIKYFKKTETLINRNIRKIKAKLYKIKKSNKGNKGNKNFRLLISYNLLYSILVVNGLFYIFIKGLTFPIKSLAEVDKVIANLSSRIVKVLTSAFKGPTKLVLTNLQTNNLTSKESKTRNSSTLLNSNELKIKKQSRVRQSRQNDDNSQTRAQSVTRQKATLKTQQNTLSVKDNNVKQEQQNILNINDIKNGVFDKIQKTLSENQNKNSIKSDDLQINANTIQNNNKSKKDTKSSIDINLLPDLAKLRQQAEEVIKTTAAMIPNRITNDNKQENKSKNNIDVLNNNTITNNNVKTNKLQQDLIDHLQEASQSSQKQSDNLSAKGQEKLIGQKAQYQIENIISDNKISKTDKQSEIQKVYKEAVDDIKILDETNKQLDQEIKDNEQIINNVAKAGEHEVLQYLNIIANKEKVEAEQSLNMCNEFLSGEKYKKYNLNSVLNNYMESHKDEKIDKKDLFMQLAQTIATQEVKDKGASGNKINKADIMATTKDVMNNLSYQISNCVKQHNDYQNINKVKQKYTVKQNDNYRQMHS